MSEDAWVSRTTGPGVPIVERGNTGWLRARLARELHDRFYALYGLQALPVSYGTGLVTLALASPHCRRAPRAFGKLSDDRAAAQTGYPPDLPSFLETDEHVSFEQPWASWDELLQAVIDTLSLPAAHLPGHQACFHRSSRSLYPVAFEVAVTLVADPYGRWRPDRFLEWGGQAGHGCSFLGMAGIPDEHFDRYLVVYGQKGDWPGVAIGNDGMAIGLGGQQVDLAAAWRGGAPVSALADAAESITGFTDGDDS